MAPNGSRNPGKNKIIKKASSIADLFPLELVAFCTLLELLQRHVGDHMVNGISVSCDNHIVLFRTTGACVLIGPKRDGRNCREILLSTLYSSIEPRIICSWLKKRWLQDV